MAGVNLQNSIFSSYISAVLKLCINFITLIFVFLGVDTETWAHSVVSHIPWVACLIKIFQTVIIDPVDILFSIPLWLLSHAPVFHFGAKIWVFLFVENPLSILNFVAESMEILLLLYQMGWIEAGLYFLLQSNDILNKIVNLLPDANSRTLFRVFFWPLKTTICFFITNPAHYIIQISTGALEAKLESKNLKKLMDGEEEEEDLLLETKSTATRAESSMKNDGNCVKQNVDDITNTLAKEKLKIQSEIAKGKGKEKVIMAGASTSKGLENSESMERLESQKLPLSSVEASENQANIGCKSWEIVSKRKLLNPTTEAELLAPVEEEHTQAEPTSLEVIEKAGPLFPPALVFHNGLLPQAGKNSVILYTTSNPMRKREVMASKHAIHLLKKFDLDIEIRDCYKCKSLEYDLKKMLGSDTVPQLFGKGKYWGNVKQMTTMYYNGDLDRLVQGVARLPSPNWICGNCDGESFVTCPSCKGSGMLYIEGEEDDEGDECIGCSGDGLVCCEECFKRRN